MKVIKILLFIYINFLLLSCSLLMMDPPPPDADLSPAKLLLIVEQSKLTGLTENLATYGDYILANGGSIEIRPFASDNSVNELKELIILNKDTINGVFLVGDLPVAWYEQTAFGKKEQFPVDLYLMDLNAMWSDTDDNGYFDSHSNLYITHYVSRINGSINELNSYFTKLINYNRGNYENLGGAFIFKDDDWFNTFRGSSFGLERLYNRIQINENSSMTKRINYLEKLSEYGADYVYQWIHSTPSSLYIRDDDEYESIRFSHIGENKIKSRFLNMFNCKGARFTQENLAMSYLNDTETGLAITGSTKVGGNYYPLEFHRTLTLGSSWGNAFKSWYNYFGRKDDEWFLGMVILGDPTLTIKDATLNRSLSRSSFTNLIPPSEKTMSEIGKNLIYFENNI